MGHGTWHSLPILPLPHHLYLYGLPSRPQIVEYRKGTVLDVVSNVGGAVSSVQSAFGSICSGYVAALPHLAKIAFFKNLGF